MEVNKTDSGTGALVLQVKAEGAGPVHLEVSGRGPHQCLSVRICRRVDKEMDPALLSGAGQ